MKDLSRRKFLKGALVSTASVAAAGLTGMPVLAKGEGIYTPGTYSAQAQGMGTVTVTMTFSESAITGVEIDASGETAGLGTEVAQPISEAVLAAKSAQVDGVSGATVSSDAAKTAIQKCLDEAMGVEAGTRM